MDLSDEDKKIAQSAVERLHLPGDTQEWVDALRSLNIFKFRKLMKEQRDKLPAKYRKLYRADDSKLEIAMHYLRTQYSFFTQKERNQSEGFIQLKQDEADGLDILETKFH